MKFYIVVDQDGEIHIPSGVLQISETLTIPFNVRIVPAKRSRVYTCGKEFPATQQGLQAAINFTSKDQK